MFLPKPFTIQIDMASATAAFLPSEKANLEPLPRWGVRRGHLGCSAKQLFLFRKVQTPKSESRNENGVKRDLAGLKFYTGCMAPY